VDFEPAARLQDPRPFSDRRLDVVPFDMLDDVARIDEVEAGVRKRCLAAIGGVVDQWAGGEAERFEAGDFALVWAYF
jgi:hypothetical protein